MLCMITLHHTLCFQGPRVEELKTKRDRHKFHIKHLEMAMRAVDNDALGVEQVGEIIVCATFILRS